MPDWIERLLDIREKSGRVTSVVSATISSPEAVLEILEKISSLGELPESPEDDADDRHKFPCTREV